jgi:hypothetical protein
MQNVFAVLKRWLVIKPSVRRASMCESRANIAWFLSAVLEVRLPRRRLFHFETNNDTDGFVLTSAWRNLEVLAWEMVRVRLKQQKRGFLHRLLSPKASGALDIVSMFKRGCLTRYSFVRCSPSERCQKV